MRSRTNIYVSLDEAREELNRRRNDAELIQRVEADLGDQIWPIFKDLPLGVLPKYLPSPDNSFTFFIQMAHYIGTVPIVLEFLGDKFVLLNEEKKGLGRLRVRLRNGEKYTVDIVDFQENENKKINEVFTKTGESLVDFHHNLLKKFGHDVKLEDSTSWLREAGKKIDYYKYLLNFVVHGVLFEYYTEEDEYEKVFVRDVVLPNIEKIFNNYGLKPLIIKLYPENQNGEEDFYWWSYPLDINDYIIEYAKAHNFSLKPLKIEESEKKKEKKIDNAIASIKDPDEMFQEALTIQDKLTLDYFKYHTDVRMTEEMKNEIENNPQEARFKLAYEIVKKYKGEAEAEKSKNYLLKMVPGEILEVGVIKEKIKLVEFMVLSGLAKSNSDARRIIQQDGLKINEKHESNWQLFLTKYDTSSVLKVGKFKVVKIKFLSPRH